MVVKSNRQELIDNLDTRAEPNEKAGTNTLLALQKAYAMPGVDTIILFTDGDPSRTPDDSAVRFLDPKHKEYRRNYSVKCWDQIFAFVRKQQDAGIRVPINVVALGNYFDSLYGPNLVELSAMTGGTFLGRGGGRQNAVSVEKMQME